MKYGNTIAASVRRARSSNNGAKDAGLGLVSGTFLRAERAIALPAKYPAATVHVEDHRKLLRG